MKRILSLLAATVAVSAAHAQIGWRDTRIEGYWRAVAQDGSGATALLEIYPNGRFHVDINSPTRGEQTAWGSYTLTIESLGAVPNAEVLNLYFEQWISAGDMNTPPRQMRLVFFPEGDWPVITDGSSINFHRASPLAPPVMVGSAWYR